MVTCSNNTTNPSRYTTAKPVLGVFSLVMITIIAVDSIRTLPIGAEYGFSLVFYYLLAGLVFFLPAALVSAELATTWPQTGGIYVWVREAFGYKVGFVAICLQWFYNICWYPTILALIASTLAYVIDPQLINSNYYVLVTIIVTFWLATALNLMGMRVSSVVSYIGAIIGTLIPMTMIILFAILWVLFGHPMAISFSFCHFFPDIHHPHQLTLLVAIFYGLMGIEMSATHAGDVKNPRRAYPQALCYASVIILFSLILASLAIAIVVPQQQLNIISGLLQAFMVFFHAFHLDWMLPILAVMIICGAIGSMGAWIIGPTKGLLIASDDGSLPFVFSKRNRYNAPFVILIMQGMILTLLCLVFVLMPNVSDGFWLLTDVTAILSLFVYILMFAAAIYLRYKYPHLKRAFCVPGGKLGMWFVAGLGLLSSCFAIVVGFLPPSQLAIGDSLHYEVMLVVGVTVGVLLPFVIMQVNIPRK